MKEDEFLNEALDIVGRAENRGVHLRILGALAVYMTSCDRQECLKIFSALGRLGEGKSFFTDLDLAAYSKQKKEATKIFRELNFKPDEMVNAMFGDKRLIFYHPQDKYQVDIFLNKLEFSHDVNFGSPGDAGRLELDYPTITLADLVLEKLQINKINHKDLVDLMVIFSEHEVVAKQQRGVVDGGYIAKILSDDWGFWYDATTNLGKLKSLVEKATNEGKIAQAQSNKIKNGVEDLIKIIQETPKSFKWRMRERVGTKKSWYREVDEVER
jgi:hypothetical protein